MFVLMSKGDSHSPGWKTSKRRRLNGKKKSSNIIKERVSVSGPGGSLTVEAALVLPIFFFAALCLVYLLEIRSVQFSVRNAAQNAAEKAAVEVTVLPVLNSWKLEADIVGLIGAERMERSVIEGGSGGLSCWRSYYREADGIINVDVRYKVRLPFPRFLNLSMDMKESFQIRAWTGYQPLGMEGGDDDIVYVTDYGLAYHEDYQCRYLQLTIRYVPESRLSGIRNEDGGIYYPCEKCVHAGTMAGVYVTEYGNKYHNSLECSGLKRSIRAIKRSEVMGRGACGKCAK